MRLRLRFAIGIDVVEFRRNLPRYIEFYLVQGVYQTFPDIAVGKTKSCAALAITDVGEDCQWPTATREIIFFHQHGFSHLEYAFPSKAMARMLRLYSFMEKVVGVLRIP
uniref:Uncharacterized protein n=1 Tax=Parascaris equorum TaxID=6256 RepID=A0A914RUP5_PAREQ